MRRSALALLTPVPQKLLQPDAPEEKTWRQRPCTVATLLALAVLVAVCVFLDVLFEPPGRYKAEDFNMPPARLNLRPLRIPRQLVLTAKQASPGDLPLPVQENVRRMLSMSPGLRLRWLGDADCLAYLKKHFDEELIRIFQEEPRGSFRGDICRACVLAREGGFYLDLDVQLKVPVEELVDSNTTFASAFTEDQAVLNALLAAEMGSAIMLEVLQQIRDWYRPETPHQDVGTSSEWLGPVTMLRGLREVIKRECEGMPVHPEATLEWTCGPHVIRLYEEHEIECNLRGSEECPPRRAESQFQGVRYGIFTPSPKRRLVAWPRFEACENWGCAAGGWDESPTR